jgi:hypothetical protein
MAGEIDSVAGVVPAPGSRPLTGAAASGPQRYQVPRVSGSVCSKAGPGPGR